MAKPKKTVDVGVSAMVTNKGENCVELRLRTAFGMERAFALPLDLARTMAKMTMCCVGFVERTVEVSQFIQGDVHGEQVNNDRPAEPCGDAEQRRERGDDNALGNARAAGKDARSARAS